MTNQVLKPRNLGVSGTNTAIMSISPNGLSAPVTEGVHQNGRIRFGIIPSIAVVALMATGLVAFAARKLRTSAKSFERNIRETLLDDILDAVAKDVTNRAELRVELSDAIDGIGVLRTEPLASILRIEESYAKKGTGEYLRRVSILRRKNGTTGSLAKVESKVGWEYIPNAVRGKFIETREDKVVRLIYDAEGKTKA